MRKTIFILLLTLIFGVSLQAQINRRVTVQVNQQTVVPRSRLKIKFVSLIEDSRCPTDAQCIQAGSAKIQIEVKKIGGESKILELTTDQRANSVNFAGYEIDLIDVSPKPATNIRINRFGYRATFAVYKIGR